MAENREAQLMNALEMHGALTIDDGGPYVAAARALARRGLVDYEPSTGVVRRKEG